MKFYVFLWLKLLYISDDLFIYFQFFGVDDRGTMELRDENLEFLAYPDERQLLTFYDLKDVLDQYRCTGICI